MGAATRTGAKEILTNPELTLPVQQRRFEVARNATAQVAGEDDPNEER